MMRQVISLMLIIAGTLAMTSPAMAKKSDIFIFDFKFKGLSAADAEVYTADLGAVLAAEFQAACYKMGGITPFTMVDLTSQLQKEKQKELMECTGESCLIKIVENFGMSETVAGAATKSGSKFYLKVTWIKDEQVKNTVTAECAASPDALRALVKTLPPKLFDVMGGAKGGTLIKPTTDTTGKPDLNYPIEVNTYPDGAFLNINGADKGNTPYSDFLGDGSYTIKVMKPYFSPRELIINVKPGDPSTVQKFDIKLKPNFAILKITGSPTGATVLINGKQVGTLPYTVEKISPGTVQVEVTAKDHHAYSEKINLKKSQTTIVKAHLKQHTGYLQVLGKCRGKTTKSMVYLNDSPADTTPLTKELPVGVYQLKVSNECGEVSETVTVNNKQTVNMALDTDAVAAKKSKDPVAGVAAGMKWGAGKTAVFWTGAGLLTLGGIIHLVGYMGLSDVRAAEADPVTDISQKETADALDDAQMKYIAGYCLYGVGGVLVLTSLLLPKSKAGSKYGVMPINGGGIFTLQHTW